ncbi:hypothetical protein MMPV_007151 [Pyropia vietnamensis]
MSTSALATVKGVVPPPRRRAATPIGMGRPRPTSGFPVGVSAPVQESAIPASYNLPPVGGAEGPPTRALHHFVITRLRLSDGGPAGMPAPLDEVEVPGAVLAAGGVLNAPGCAPLTVSLPALTGWAVELGGEVPRLVATTSTGRYYLVGRPAAAYVAVHGRSRARRRYELLVRAVALATHLPPADATYATVVRQLGRRAAGMRAYTEADVLAERSFLLAQGWALDDPALRCSLFAQELARRGREISGGVAPTGRRATSPGVSVTSTAVGASSVASARSGSGTSPLTIAVRPSAAKPPTPPRAASPGSRGSSLSPRRLSRSPPKARTPPLPVAMRPPLPPLSPVSQPGSPPRECPLQGTDGSGSAGQASRPHLKKRKRTVSFDGPDSDRLGGVPAKHRATVATTTAAKAFPSGAAAASASATDAAEGPLCACGGAPGGCGGTAPAASGSKYASDACGMARARQRVMDMSAAGMDVDSFVRIHVEPLSRRPRL